MKVREILKESGLDQPSIIWIIGGLPFIVFYCLFYYLMNKSKKNIS